MSTTTEKSITALEGDSERSAEYEQEIVDIREQLDERITAADLSDSQRNLIVERALRDIDGLMQGNKTKDASSSKGLADVWNWTADLVEESVLSSRSVNYHHQQARNYFIGALLEKIQSINRQGDGDGARGLSVVVADKYFDERDLGYTIASADENGIDGQLEVILYAQQSLVTTEIAKEMYGAIIMNGARAEKRSLFSEQIIGEDPASQLEAIDTIAKMAMQVMYWGRNMPHGQYQGLLPFAVRVLNGFQDIIGNDELTPFVDLALRARGDEIYQALMREQAYAEGLYDEYDRVHPEFNAEIFNEGSTQEELHDKFPGNGNDALLRVADGAVTRIGDGLLIDELITVEGERVNLADISSRNDLNLSDEEAVLLKALYQPYTRYIAESEIGISLNNLSLQTQLHLLDFMVKARPGRYHRLTNILAGAGESRQQLAEAFLALEFGDDYGDILLDLAESEDKQGFAETLAGIESVRLAGERIAGHFDSGDALDGAIAQRMPTAFIKRTTELLALARQDGLATVIEPLRAVSGAVTAIAKSLDEDTFSHADVTPEFGAFSSDSSPVAVSSRPHGKNARLGFTVRGMGENSKQRLSIRLDYEAGELSLDIGSTAKKGVDVSGIAALVGDTMAKGEEALMRYRAVQGSEEHEDMQLHGNHVREAFADMDLLQPEEFAGVVNRFMMRLRNRGALLKVGQHATAQQIVV